MKIYGCGEQEDSGMEILAAVTVVAEPASLRELASFLYRCADSIEDGSEQWEQEEFETIEHTCPQIVIFNPTLIDD